MACRIIPPWIIVLFVMSVASRKISAEADKPRCPNGTLNEGWIVDKGHAFSDPLDCCDHRVADWQAFDEYETPYTETGCSLSVRILGTEMNRFIAPVTCRNDSSCGEQDFVGNRMQCCPGDKVVGGYCAAVLANGESRCEKVAALIQWAKEDEDEDAAAKEFTAFASRCYSQDKNDSVCVSCSATCADGAFRFEKTGTRENVIPVEERIKIDDD